MNQEICNVLDKLFNILPQIRDGEFCHVQIYSPSNLFDSLLKKHFSAKNKNAFLTIKTNTILPEFLVKDILEHIEAVDKKITAKQLLKYLETEKYERVQRAFDSGSFHIRGDSYLVISYGSSKAYRFDFFGDDLDQIIEVDPTSLRAVRELKKVLLFPKLTLENNNFIEIEVINEDKELDKNFVLDITSTQSFSTQVIDLNLANVPILISQKKLFDQDISKWIENKYDFVYAGHDTDKFHELVPKLKHVQSLDIQGANADKGFVSDKEKIIFLTDREIFGKLELTAKIKKKNKIDKLFQDSLSIGDYVVHEFHGIGIYDGIQCKNIDGKDKDFIVLKYLENDALFIPIDQTNRLTKFVGSEESAPKLTRLGSAEWENIKKRIAKSIEDLADELLDLYAKRELSKGFEYSRDTEMMNHLEASFPYEETEDQSRAILEIKEDMESEKPMDRLLVGDVGFGKTEIAVRSAFKAVLDHKQVAVLAPTTVLAAQLHSVFSERLKQFPVTVARLTRFDGPQKNKETVEKLKEGKIDIIVGTHRLLSADVEFKDLGFLVIDEEQRFGVKQKEKIKHARVNVDVLSMSATPIPRTLQMSLAGIREISILSTPPKGRMPIKTEIVQRNETYGKIKEEIQRQGKVFFVHNSINSIEITKQMIENNVPNIKIGIGHGRMSGPALEKVMFQFMTGEFDVLLATTIVENGLDLPNVNTIIIDDAQKFGLSQLHQLRGRVGRGKVQAYCYLVVPQFKVSEDIEEALKYETEQEEMKNKDKRKTSVLSKESIDRVKTLVANQDLGAGFRIASKDMEMRGSGNILGSQQSGNINAIGYELYMRLLAEQIENKKRLASEKKK